VQLIIRAGSLGQGATAGPAEAGSTDPRNGAIYVLDMGDPIKIVDLAETMIRLSGFEPGRDIAIEFVGQRPGEKFHEELFNPYERLQPTPAQRIVRAQRDRLDPAWVDAIFDNINLLVLEGDAAALAEHVSELDASRTVLPPETGARVAP
jgi:FlaA1/EpsC-like NDP-sugar epimerase